MHIWPPELGTKICPEQRESMKITILHLTNYTNYVWIPIHYPTYLTKSPTVSVYSFHMIFHVTISDFCSVPLFLSVFVPSLGGQIRVSTLYHQSYWYCWWSILHEKRMPIDIQNFPSVIHLAKVRNNQYSFVLISPSLNNLSFISSYIIDSFCCWNFYWVLRSILLSTLCVKNECHTCMILHRTASDK